MYENIVIESNTNVFDNMEVQGVCDGAAHQMRMIKRARSERRTLVLFMFLFLFLCAVVSSVSLSLCLSVSVSLSLSLCLSVSFLQLLVLLILLVQWLDPSCPTWTTCTSSSPPFNPDFIITIFIDTMDET